MTGLLQNLEKLSALDHPALAIIVLRGMLREAAADVDAGLVLWALNIVISIPACFKTNFNHQDIVSVDTALYGF